MLTFLLAVERMNTPPAYEVVYFRRTPDEPEDSLRVPVGTAEQHIRGELITRIVPALGVAVMGHQTVGDHTPIDSGTPSTPIDPGKAG